MSDTMLFGVLRMPYELAMGDELSRIQFYDRVQEALPRIKAASEMLDALLDCREALRRAGATGELAVVNAAIAKASGLPHECAALKEAEQ